ncbi:MAG: hypothetical protein M3O15_11995, partial [Acidobacteriota bacterium]|nr:hypothetical protein [Acidobacteriota bacterium]
IWRSADGGGSWEARNGMLPAADLAVFALAVAPHDPDTVYAVPVGGAANDGLLRSEDGGATWVVLHQLPFINQLAFDPAHGDALLAAAEGGLYRSVDKGGSWQRAGFAGSAVNAVAVDPLRPSILLAVVFEGNTSAGRVWRSRDDGSTWTATTLAAANMRNLTPDPAHPGTVYVLAGPLIYKSADHGASWTALPEIVYFPNALAVSPAGALFAAPYPGYVEGIVRSGDGGRTWTPDPKGDPSLSSPPDFVQQVLVSGADPRLILAVGQKGVWRSTDEGATWHPSSRGMLATAPTSVAIGADASRSVFCTVSGQLLRSEDAGAHWRGLQSPLGLGFSDVVTDPLRPGVLYLADRLLKSRDGGRSFESISPFSSTFQVSVSAFAIDPRSPDVLYLSGVSYVGLGHDQSAFVARSGDGGKSWKFIAPDLSNLTVMVVDPLNPRTVYGAELGSRLWRSVDSGRTWTRTGAGLPFGGGGDPITALAVDPFDDEIVYCGTGGHGVYRSTDGGQHFTPMNLGLESAKVVTLIVDPLDAGTLFAGAVGQGVFRWRAGDGMWKPINDGLPVLPGALPSFAGALALDAGRDLLYAATPMGIYRLSEPDGD